MSAAPRLNDSTHPVDRPERVGIAHLGLGAFHRAHQAWYTARAEDRREWGIAAFTGRGPAAATVLAAQDGQYTLIERGPVDRAEVVGQIVQVHSGDDAAAWRRTLADPGVRVLTTTVTERGYRLTPSGAPDWSDPALLDDLEVLRADDADAGPRSALGRIVTGLRSRQRGSGAPLSVIPCDNVPANGAWLRRGVLDLADRVDPRLAAWIASDVAFVSTAVDRITPATTPPDRSAAEALTGFVDEAVVVTESYASWVLEGRFAADRPRWEAAGAEFVDDVAPYEQRKLWMLNGAHTALAVSAAALGVGTVAEAMEIAAGQDLVEQVWDAAARHLPPGLDPAGYRDDLRQRFGEPRIRHRLAQIAADSAGKLRLRIVPVVLRELHDGRDGEPGARVVAAWIGSAVRGAVQDAELDAIRAAAGESDPVRALLDLLDPALAADSGFVARVRRHAARTPVPTAAR